MAKAPEPRAGAPRERPIPWPATRPLRIYTTDPTRGYEPAAKTTLEVEFEPLKPGPIGDRIEVVDYDGYVQAYYPQVDLDDPAILMQGGLQPSEADPRFHQQMVYAVASRTLANFDRALGRRISMRKGSRRTRLRILPHAFRGRNAYYDRDLHALLFGYFAADAGDVGTNLPGQTIYSCLSHDIIAHEMTHAVLDRLKRYFLEPSNPDAPAFHEGFADLVALFQHFSFPDLLAAEIRRTRADLRKPTLLVDLARQFGFATGEGRSLRTALDEGRGSLDQATEAHDRGAVLVAAVFDGFLTTYAERTRDLILIATDGRGELPAGDLSPYLANRLAVETARIAQSHLSICIRALDYLPPVDVTFGDYLRALVTADFELNPGDNTGQRAALIEGFRRRGIHPTGVISLAEESLRWPVADNPMALPRKLRSALSRYLAAEAAAATQASTDPRLFVRRAPPENPDIPEDADVGDGGESRRGVSREIRDALVTFAQEHLKELMLSPDFPIYLYSVNGVFRTSATGQPVIEIIAQFVQTDPAGEFDAILGGIKVRGGTTIVIGADGVLSYAIGKPIPGPHLVGSMAAEAPERIKAMKRYVSALDARDPLFPYMGEAQLAQRMTARMSLRSLHRERWG